MGLGKCLPTRLNDLQSLNLKQKHYNDLNKIVNDNKIQWEIWIESAKDYSVLRQSLNKRGYRNTPMSDLPEILSNMPTNTSVIANLPNQKTMMRKD